MNLLGWIIDQLHDIGVDERGFRGEAMLTEAMWDGRYKFNGQRWWTSTSFGRVED